MQMEHGGSYTSKNRIPALFYNNAPGVLNGRIGTSDDENNNVAVTIGTTFPSWFHVSIRVCGTTSTGTTCAQGWGQS